jgi:hypothetical protein
LRLPKVPPRALDLARNVAVLLVCAAGLAGLARVLDRHYALSDWLIWRVLAIGAYALLFNASCVAGGAAVLGLIFRRRQLPALDWLLQSMAVGVTAFVLCLYAAGAFCSFKPWMAIAIPMLLLAAGFRAAPRLASGLTAFYKATPRLSLLGGVAAFLAVGWGAASLAFLYLEALDVSAINFDAQWYHFPVAQDYARTGCIVAFPGDNHRAFPHLTSMLHTWALLVPGLEPLPLHWMLSLHLEYSIVIWRIVGVAAGMSWMLEGARVRGLWVVFFLFPSVFIYDQSIGGSADHFLGFFAMPIALAAARTLRAFEWRWAVVLGVVMGGHLLTKYQAVYVLAGATVVCASRWLYLCVRHVALLRDKAAVRKRRLRRLLYGAGAAALTAILVSSPHFVKNAIFYKNPVYPFAQSVFTASTPKHEPRIYKEVRPPSPFPVKYSGLRRQLWTAELLIDYSFTTRNRDFTARRPYMGSLFSLLLPCILFVQRRRRVWPILAIAIGAFWTWANLGPNDRYMLGFYDMFIACAGALAVLVWRLGWIARAGLVPLVALQLFWGGDAMLFYGAKQLKYALNLIDAGYAGKKDEQRFGAGRKQQQITAATPSDAVILARNYKGLLGLDRTVLMDIRQTQDYINYSRLRDARELWRYYQERGVTHLLYPDGDRRPVRWNNTLLFAELFHHHATDVRRFGNLVLGKMPTAPPAASTPYLVLTRRLIGYPDGVYRIEQLDIDERSPASSYPKLRPEPPYTEEDATELLGQVDAVAVGNAQFQGPAAQALKTNFDRVERFNGYEVYLRRRK